MRLFRKRQIGLAPGRAGATLAPMEPILHPPAALTPEILASAARLPGTAPASPEAWLRADAAFAPQMGLRDQIVATQGESVVWMCPEAQAAVDETLTRALDWAARHGYARSGGIVTRPDGQRVNVQGANPMAALARLTQQDICILERRGAEHVLTAAALCFPASWSLAEKRLKPLTAIHGPVAEYGPGLAARVQRLFDGISPGRPLWRANALAYNDPALHQPRREADPRPAAEEGAYIRSEIQVLARLPETDAMVFTIHTMVFDRRSLSPAQIAALGQLER